MAETSNIEWTDATWNPVTGCTKVSPGCAHCYAETFAERFRGVPGHPYEHGFDIQLRPERLTLPLSWRKPRRVFVNSMSDLFHEAVPFEFIDQVFATMALTPQHTYQVLTKRPERMREYISARGSGVGMEPERENTHWRVAEQADRLAPGEPRCWDGINPDEMTTWPLPNVWLGTSAENQRWADIRVPELLATPAAVRFVSYEPALGPVDFTSVTVGDDWNEYAAVDHRPLGLDWIIVGGESGPKSRPFDVAWARSVVEQCRAAGVAVFVKQLGSKYGREWGLRSDPKAGRMENWPADLRVREMPR